MSEESDMTRIAEMGRKRMKSCSFLLAVLIVVIFVSGCYQEETLTKHPTDSGKNQEVAPSKLNLSLGETASTSKLAVTILSANKTQFYFYYSDIFDSIQREYAGQEKIFIVAEATIKNIGSDSVYVGSTEFSATDSEGYRYDPELYGGDDGLDMFKELYENQKMGGRIVFKVPENASALRIQYDFGDIFTGPILATWWID